MTARQTTVRRKLNNSPEMNKWLFFNGIDPLSIHCALTPNLIAMSWYFSSPNFTYCRYPLSPLFQAVTTISLLAGSRKLVNS